MRELLRQEMEQSTLDEIFTLLEPWLRRDCPAAREMSITILHSCLDTYLQNVDFKGSAINDVCILFSFRTPLPLIAFWTDLHYEDTQPPS